MKKQAGKAGAFIWALLLVAIISHAAIKHGEPTDTITVGKPMPDITESMHADYRTLLKMYGKNKEMPVGYEKQIIYALSYFPELIHTKIEFRIKKSTGGIISTRPLISSLFRKSSKRRYLVIINDTIEGRRLPTWLSCEANGQVGILGHELCHIIYFSKHTGLGLFGLGMSHISKSFMDRFENKTDSVDIERGLGYQLIAWNEYLHKRFSTLQNGGTLPGMKAGTRERYMNIEHIRRVMLKSKVYSK